jgi:hypothetical protein
MKQSQRLSDCFASLRCARNDKLWIIYLLEHSYAIAATQKSPSGLETLNLLFLPLCPLPSTLYLLQTEP